MVDNPIGARNFRPQNLIQLCSVVWSVGPSGDQDSHTLALQSRPLERRKDWREENGIWDGPGDIANNDTGISPALSKSFQRLSADRVGKRLHDCGVRIRDGRRR